MFTDALQRAILSGELPPGHRLPPERELAGRYKMSRTAVREALRSLADQELVEATIGRGTFVRTPGTHAAARVLGTAVLHAGATVRQVVDARRMLEAQAAATLAARDSSELDALAAAMDSIRAPGAGLRDLARRDLAFHRALVVAAGNSVLSAMFESIAGLSYGLMLETLSHLDDSDVWRTAHQGVIDAVIGGDPEVARRAVSEHFDVGADLCGNDYDRALDIRANPDVLLPPAQDPPRLHGIGDQLDDAT
jgi:GntR family transcriptional repressor for pyruvate dehydrogenase complex